MSPARRSCWSIRSCPSRPRAVFAAVERRRSRRRSATGATGAMISKCRRATLVPAIGDVLDWLGSSRGATFVRMSGSGATCFALFDRRGRARCRRVGLSRSLVASGDHSCARGRACPPDPHRRTDARRRSRRMTSPVLMERAGAALGRGGVAVRRPDRDPDPVGPGNNGGDGRVAARHLEARGMTGAAPPTLGHDSPTPEPRADADRLPVRNRS